MLHSASNQGLGPGLLDEAMALAPEVRMEGEVGVDDYSQASAQTVQSVSSLSGTQSGLPGSRRPSHTRSLEGFEEEEYDDGEGELDPLTDHVVHDMISGWKLTTKEEKRRLLSQTSHMGMSDMSDGDSVSLPSILMAR